ncbi:WhiB family transcriptional regulator [Rhodococcus qingshengii]|uniref:WhiB family transcriptional regulator n=1 Tax=Rhodococcus qingshengii TaxID=334542 RepID=UPI001C5D09D5|nr:WhiB family transcriptional regulator [Rhodococcus qingshengii]MBW4818401.1 WhiB family transcriptional regulator [Rhodococcus qingshengii]
MPASESTANLTAVDVSWRLRAECRDADPSTFFSPEGERGQARATRESRAKRICNRCPVLQACREHALIMAEAYGIWGGMTERDRKRHALDLQRRHRAVGVCSVG